jgi:predicted amidophosphoribosyltransferase
VWLVRWREAARALAQPLDPVLGACTAVPPAGPGVCAGCHAACRPDRVRCPTCRRTAGQVTHPVAGVVPISLFRTGDDLWYLLRRYKDGRDRLTRRRCRRGLARLLAGFLRGHLACVAPDARAGWELTVVPPTRRRAGRYPMERVIGCSPWLRRQYRRTLRTARAPGHNRADDAAFVAVGPLAGRRLLLVDDTFTTGASLQSAASALRAAGATVLGAVVIGRVVNPAIPAEAALWAAARARRFRLDRCCRCLPPAPSMF